MINRKPFACALLLGMSVLAAQTALALPVKISGTAPNVSFVVVNGQRPLAVFRRFNDLWIVADGTQDPLELPPGFNMGARGITGVEHLQVSGGSGLRIQFKKLQGLQVSPVAGGISIGTVGSSVATPTQVHIAQDDGQTKVGMPGQGHMLRATSLESRESYLVLTNRLPGGVTGSYDKGALKVLPSAQGGVFASSEGLPLGYAVDSKSNSYTISPLKDTTSLTLAHNKGTQALSLVDSLFTRLRQEAPKPKPLPHVSALPRKAAVKPVAALPAQPAPNPYQISLPLGGKANSNFKDAYGSLSDALQVVGNLSLPHTAPGTAQQAAQNAAHQALPENTFLPDYGPLSMGDIQHLEDRMRLAIIGAPTMADRDSAIYRLANLKMFIQQYPEAMGLLGTMQIDPVTRWPKDADGRVLMAAANVMMHRTLDAQHLINSVDQPSLNRLVWLAAVDAQAGNIPDAINLFEAGQKQIAKYPQVFRQYLQYLYAKSLFKAGRGAEASNLIDSLAALGDSPVLPYAQLLKGDINEAQDNAPVAEQIYVSLASNPDKIVANRAVFNLLKLLTRRGAMTPQVAALRFENLRYMWRGGDVEHESLYELGQLYEKMKQYRKALERYKYLADTFPNSERAQQAKARMAAIFKEVFLDEKPAAGMDALSTIALYYQFQSLAPGGAQGDELALKMAGRLKKAALYDKAATLLESHLAKGVSDPQMAGEMGLEAAKLYGLANSPEQGLKALAQSNIPNLAPDLVTNRAVAQARLEIAAKQPDAAQKTLADLTTPDAMKLKAQMAWEANNYPAVTAYLNPFFGSTGGKNWTDADKNAFIELAMSYAMQGNGDMVADLALRYRDGIIVYSLQPQIRFLLSVAGGATDPAAFNKTFGDTPEAGTWGRLVSALKADNGFMDNYNVIKTQWDKQRAAAEAEARKQHLQELQDQQQ